jgi:hypothetical protein
MFSLEKRTLMRGRSLVPEIFLRMRQWRNPANRCFLSVLMLMGPRILPWPIRLY